MHTTLTYITLILYTASALVWLVFLATLKKDVARWAKLLLVLAAAVHLGAIGWHHYHHLPPPVLHPISLLNLGAFVLVVSYLIAGVFYDLDIVGVFIAPVVTVVLFSALSEPIVLVPSTTPMKFITPVHIASSVLAFLGFTVSFIAAVLYAIQDFAIKIKRLPVGLPALATLENVSIKSIVISFPIYTFAVILGAIWASSRPDAGLSSPQYLAGIVSWWLYALVLYGYLSAGWRGRKTIALVIAAYAGVASLALFYAIKVWRGM